jgi:hypothetical protein
MSACAPSRVTMPEVVYLTAFGLVLMSRLKLNLTVSPLFCCSSSFAFTSKNSPSVGEGPSTFSAWSLYILIETVTPAAEYFGLITNTPSVVGPNYI